MGAVVALCGARACLTTRTLRDESRVGPQALSSWGEGVGVGLPGEPVSRSAAWDVAGGAVEGIAELDRGPLLEAR